MDKLQRKRALQKARNERNKEYRRDYYKRYYIRNRDKLKSEGLSYRKSRFFSIRANHVHARSRTSSAKKLTEIISRLWYKQRGICALTGRRLTRWNAQVDHIVPVSSGGNNDESNLRWVTSECNRAKSNLSDSEFIRLCRDIVSMAKRNGSLC